MDTEKEQVRNVIFLAVGVEGGLLIAALVCDRLFRLGIVERVYWNIADVAIGFGSIIPLLLLLLVFVKSDYAPFRAITNILQTTLLPIFGECSTMTLVFICGLAGFGEELAFRGMLQLGITGLTSAGVGVVVNSVIFGALHWITPVYAVLATAVGLYFSLIFLMTDNLLTVIVAHGVYDYVAIRYLLKKGSEV